MEVKMSKNGHFQHYHRFYFWGNFLQILAIFRQQKEISKHNFDLVSFFPVHFSVKAGKNSYQVKRFELPCFLALQKKVKMVKNSRRRKKSSPGRHSALVTVRSVQSGHGICQNLRKNQAFLMVLNFNLQNIYGTLQVRICKVSNLARGPCTYITLHRKYQDKKDL